MSSGAWEDNQLSKQEELEAEIEKLQKELDEVKGWLLMASAFYCPACHTKLNSLHSQDCEISKLFRRE